ncbi:precorrin-2 C(20)-methyltransferase [Fusibacter sp. JL216-2]|uniref:precorrin-2 C(20)-methyltransferase n=1 Tax=Fusibacter sp. JL216-2 TaxID=3071453 RepID=UPI003D32A6DF
MAGKFVGIGVGPGDPDLITVKAIKAIEAADVLVCPEARNGKGSFAFEIAEAYIPKETEILTLEFPMVHDHDVMMEAWKKNAEIISERVQQGANVAFLTLGDPTVYSTYMYLLPLLTEGVAVETIPGITSFCAVAANQNLPLALWEETFGIVPLKHGCETAEKALDHYDNVIIMKPSHDSERLAEILEEKNLQDKFVMISKCSTDIQQVTTDIQTLKDGNVPYLSTMIVKRKGF